MVLKTIYLFYFQVYEEQNVDSNSQIIRQSQTISKLEQDFNHLEKSSNMTSKRLEVENSSLQLHTSKIEQQLLDSKLHTHDLQSDLKHKNNELVSTKQALGKYSFK